MRSRVRFAGVLAVAALAGGCISGGGGEREPTELDARLLELQRENAMNQVELARLRRRVAELEAAAVSAVQAPPVTELPPAVDTAPLAAAEDIEETDLAPPPPSASRVPEPLPRPAAEAGEHPLVPEAQRLYDDGYTLYHQRHYLDAEAAFQRFLQQWGESELGDNAQYWIGESRYARGDFAGAMAAFREAVERYPDGNKAPDSLLKLGQSLESLGDVEGAREAYGEILRRYPTSAAAAAAEERRDALR